MNATFLSWFLNVATRNFRMSRGGHIILDVYSKGCEAAEHVATKVEVNPRMISTLKNSTSIWRMNPRGNFDKLMVVPLVILVALVKRQRGQGYSKSGVFVGRPSMSPFLDICFRLAIETWPKRLLIIWEKLFSMGHIQLEQHYSCFFEGWLWNFHFEDSLKMLSVVGWYPRTTLRFNKFIMLKSLGVTF